MNIKKYLKNRNFLLEIILAGSLFLMMAVSIFYTPYPPNEMNTNKCFLQPCLQHLFGTDNFARDILSRLMKGSQTAFFIGFLSVVIDFVFGVLIGSIAGYFGGIIDDLVMRIIDAKMAFPGVLLALMLISIFGTGFYILVLALGIMAISRFARITRGEYMQYKKREFVNAEKARRASAFRIMYIHILPNIISPLIVTCSLSFASAILSEAGLSYLGLGIQPPNPSWGKMLNEAQVYMLSCPWYAVAPGMMITIIVVAFNLIGDGIRDINDPRIKE